MKKKLLALLSTGVLGSLLVSAPAHAEATLSSVALSKTVIVVDGNWGCGDRSAVTVKVNEPANQWSSFTNVSAKVVDQNNNDIDYLLMSFKSKSGDTSTYADNINLCGFDQPGRYNLKTEVSWYDGSNFRTQQRVSAFYVKRPTSLTYNATPEPVKRGSKLHHTGQLKYDAFGYGDYYGPAGVKLTLQFRPTGSSTFVTKGTITTKAQGKFDSTLVATADGTWRLIFPTNNYRQNQTKEDYVDTV